MKTFETVSFHIIKPCNMKCKFCYGTFNDIEIQKQLTFEESCEIIYKLYKAGVKKITFTGGEPMLYKHLDRCIKYAKLLGLTTSIITNGSLISFNWLVSMKKHLDWIGLSIDSLNYETNKKIGRIGRDRLHYNTLIKQINHLGYKLKINTVVNIHNQDEIISDFITQSKATRWKVFDTLKVEGQNDKQFNSIKSTNYNQFIKNNQHPSMVIETNDLMTGSYLLIDPLGRLFENTQGKHTYSKSLINNNIEDCLQEINLNRNMFIKRGGIYNW